jgi:HTH-type transcriptional regulator / antitoxin HipB
MENSVYLRRLGSSFRELRKNRGLTQDEVAKLAGISRRRVIEIEAGKDSASISNHARLAAALGAEVTVTPRSRPTLEEMRSFN